MTLSRQTSPGKEENLQVTDRSAWEEEEVAEAQNRREEESEINRLEEDQDTMIQVVMYAGETDLELVELEIWFKRERPVRKEFQTKGQEEEAMKTILR